MPVVINGTTGISGVDGSAGTPSYQGGDTNTGIFYPAADTIAFAEGGTEVMRIDSSGNVGVGTTSPSEKLQVGGNIFANTGNFISNRSSGGANTSGSGLALQIDGVVNAAIRQPAAEVLAFYRGNGGTNETMRIDALSNVGIGTSSPNAKVDISGTAIEKLRFTSTASGKWKQEVNFYNNSSQKYVIGNDFTDNGTNNFYLYDAAAAKATMFIKDNSFVGFGTTNPSAPLHVVNASGVGNSGVGMFDNPGDASFGVCVFARTTGGSDNPSICLSHNNGGSPNNFGIAVNSSGDLLFNSGVNPTSSAGTTRARIFSNGVFLINDTAQVSSERFGVTGDNVVCSLKGTNTSNVTTLRIERATTDGDGVTFFYGGTQKGYISIVSTGTTYNTLSDYRLKENIAPMTGALEKVAKLKPVVYDWKGLNKSGQGFIAHELAEVVPECVTGEKDAVKMESYVISPAEEATYDEDGNELTPKKDAVMGEREVPSYQGVDTSFLVATLTAAIQEQQAMIEELKAKVAALEK